MWLRTSSHKASSGIFLAEETLFVWKSAALREICGSNPLADSMRRSWGIVSDPGFSFWRKLMRVWTFLKRISEDHERLDPPEMVDGRLLDGTRSSAGRKSVGRYL